jgi:hypothetical protein
MTPLDENRLGEILNEFHPQGRMDGWRAPAETTHAAVPARRKLAMAFAPVGVLVASAAAIGLVALSAGIHNQSPRGSAPAAVAPAATQSAPAIATVKPSTPTLSPGNRTTVHPSVAATPSGVSGLPTTPQASATPPSVCPPAPPGNVLPNSSFESSNPSGWGSWQGTFAEVTPASPVPPGGTHVARVGYNGNWQYSLEFDPVNLCPTAGDQYQLSAYVAAATPSMVGKQVSLTFRERSPTGVDLQEMPVKVTLTNSFQHVSVVGKILHSGDTIDVFIINYTGASGDAFYADQVTLNKI